MHITRLNVLPQIGTIVVLARLHREHGFSFEETTLRPFLLLKLPHYCQEGLYGSLLRQGRVWDYCDLFSGLSYNMNYRKLLEVVDRSIANRFQPRPHSGLGILASDWVGATPTGDLSSNLALLALVTKLVRDSFLYHDSSEDNMVFLLEQATILAQSILSHSPGAVRSRPYLDWILLKSYHSNRQGFESMQNFVGILKAIPGVSHQSNQLDLPQYIPRSDENPGWRIQHSKPEFQNAVRLVLRTARELGDYQTEIAALNDLIRLSSDPRTEFEDLCTLLKLNGAGEEYARVLTSKYLVSTTTELRDKLKQELLEFLAGLGATEIISARTAWMVNMLYFRLEGLGSPPARAALETARRLHSGSYLPKDLMIAILARHGFLTGDDNTPPGGSGQYGERAPFSPSASQYTPDTPEPFRDPIVGVDRFNHSQSSTSKNVVNPPPPSQTLTDITCATAI